MNIIDSLPKNVAKSIMERSGGILETDERCEKHSRYNKLAMPDGEVICPVCYGERRDAIVAKEKTEQYYQESVEGKRQYLYTDSIVSNRGLLKKGFKEFMIKTDAEAKIRKQAEDLTYDIASGTPINVYMQGVPGCGKSHIAMGLIRNANAITKGKRSLFVNFPSLQQKIRSSYGNQYSEDTEPKLIQKMIDAEILVLDDVASEINPLDSQGDVSGFSERILYAVMDARAEIKPTIITSNISWDNLKKSMDPRIYSRMGYRLKIISFANIKDKRKGDN